jgi:molybdopterin converting factor small subunit
MGENDQIRARLFGGLEAQTGAGVADVSLQAAGLATAADLVRAVGLPEGAVGLILVNGLHAKPGTSLASGDEVSLFPFVGGG